MAEAISLLMVQFLDWVSSRRRTYPETMAAWRTSCPRLSVWEDALFADLVRVEGSGPSQPPEVTLTPRGWAVLDVSRGRRPTPAGAEAGERGAMPDGCGGQSVVPSAAEPTAAPDRPGS
jgi:hypothetical protein